MSSESSVSVKENPNKKKRNYNPTSLICDWFVNNKPSNYFGKNKTKSIFLISKFEFRKNKPLNIYYKGKKKSSNTQK